MDCNNQTIRYAISVGALTALGIGALIVDGEIGMTIAVGVAGAIGYMAKDWRAAKAVEVKA